jgi:malonyl-CoA O-methyltransferase
LDLKAPYVLDTRSVRRSFDRASATYDAVAVLQTEIRQQLLLRLDLTALAPRLVLDVGAATGHASRALKQRYPRARVLSVDSAFGMLKAAEARLSWRRRFDRIGADAEALPLPDASVDLIFSNLLLPWCDPDRLFAELRRVLAPRGLLTCSGFGPDTLSELRIAWDAVDDRSHVNRFIDMHDLGDGLVRAGFAAPVLDVERYTLQYDDVPALIRDLKGLGARNFTAGRPRGLTGRAKYARLQAAYEARREQGRLPATYEVVFAQAWAPATRDPRPAGAATSIGLAELRRRLPSRRDSS